MAAPKQPDVWAEFITGTHTSGGWSGLTTYRWSKRPFADAGTYEGGWKEGRVEEWDPIERALSDRQGQPETSTYGWTINDIDRLVRGFLGGLNTEHLVNRESAIKLASSDGRGAATAARVLARGRIRDPQPLDDYQFKFVGEDIIGTDFGPLGPSKIVGRITTRELFSDIHRDVIGRLQPIIYGESSDSGATDDDGFTNEKGAHPCLWVGTEVIAGVTWDRYLVAGHACKQILSWFATDQASPATRVKQATATAGVDFLIPGQAGWPFGTDYRDLVDSDGVTHRVTLIYAKGAVSDAHKSGSINITVNVCGVESVGDCSGVLIRYGFRAYQHAMEHWVCANNGKGYYSGNWPALSEWALGSPTVTQIKTETFADAQTQSATRLGDGVGYLVDFSLTDVITRREFVRRWNVSLDARSGVNHHWQMIVATIDDVAVTSSDTLYRERIEIKRLPAPRLAHDEVENYVVFSYDWDADKKKFRADKEFVEDTLAQDALGGEKKPSSEQQMYMVRDVATARDVAGRRLLRLKRVPRYQPVVLDLSGLEKDLGERFRLTHGEGLGTSGYSLHPFLTLRHRLDLEAMEVTLVGFDLSRIIAFAASALDDEGVGGFDGIVLGDETSLVEPPTGAYELR